MRQQHPVQDIDFGNGGVMPSAQLIEEIVRKVLAESCQVQTSTGPKVMILERQDRVNRKDLARQLPKDACPMFIEYKNGQTVKDIAGGEYERLIR